MSKRFYRVLMVALLVATVALKMSAAPIIKLDVRAAVIAILAREGATLREDSSPQGDLARPMLFGVPGCEGVLQVIPVTLSLQESTLFATIVKEGYSRRFVYLDRVWLTEDRLGMRIEWLKRKALSFVGLNPYAASATALLVAEPPHCTVAQSIDWSAVWRRDQNPATHKDGAQKVP